MSLDICEVHVLKFSIFCLDCDCEVCQTCVLEHETHSLSSKDDFLKCRINSYKCKIEKNPLDADSFFKLGRLLKADGETIELQINNELKSFTGRQLYLQAIDLDKTCPNSYNNLGTLLKKNEEIELLNGLVVNETKLYMMALENDANYYRAYYNIGITLLNEKSEIQLLNGTKMNKLELLTKAIELDPKDSGSANTLAVILKNRYDEIKVYGKVMTKEDLLLKSISLDGTYLYPYRNLALLLKPDEEIQLLDGTKWNRQQLLLKVLEIDPMFSNAYSDLANNLTNLTDTVELPNGEKLNKQSLYIRSIGIDEKLSFSYFNLSLTMKTKTETIKLQDGKDMSKQQLLVKAIEQNPSYAGFYNSLGLIVKGSEVVQLHNGDTFNEQQLFFKSCELDPNYSHAYNNIATTLANNQQLFKLPNGEKLSKKDLFIKAISLNKNTHDFFNNLAGILENTEEVTLLDGSKTNKRMLYAKTLEVNPQYTRAYTSLIRELTESDYPPQPKPPANDSKITPMPIDKLIQQYYDFRIPFHDQPISISRVLQRFITEFGLTDEFLDLISFSFNTFKGLGVAVSNNLKSLENYMMKSDIKVFNRIDRLVDIDILFQPLATLRLLLETRGDQILPSKEGQCKYLYQHLVFKFSQDRDTSPGNRFRFYILSQLIDIVEYFDQELNANSNFIYKIIEQTIKQYTNNNNNLVINASNAKEQIIKSLYEKDIKNPIRPNDIIFSMILYLQKPNRTIESTLDILKYSNEKSQLVETYLLYNELGDMVQEFPQDLVLVMPLECTSAKDLYLKAIQICKFSSYAYASLGKLLQDNETIQIDSKEFDKFELYRLSIQLGNKDSSIFYHLAILLHQSGKKHVKIPLLNSESNNYHYNYLDLICQAIYHSPITFNHSTYRYYLSLIRYLNSST